MPPHGGEVNVSPPTSVTSGATLTGSPVTNADTVVPGEGTGWSSSQVPADCGWKVTAAEPGTVRPPSPTSVALSTTDSCVASVTVNVATPPPSVCAWAGVTEALLWPADSATVLP